MSSVPHVPRSRGGAWLPIVIAVLMGALVVLGICAIHDATQAASEAEALTSGRWP